MKNSKTFEASIYIGLREGYSNKHHSYDEVKKICQDYVDSVGWCVTITKTEYIYKGGNENGVIIGIINYPRFPLHIDELKRRTQELGNILLEKLNQHRVSIVYPNETIMEEKYE